MTGLPGYDAYKLETPPEYELPDCCPSCGEPFGEVFRCVSCGWTPDENEPGDAYDTLEEREMDR